nr:MAG TPA: Protein of unknown function (DUF1056) [Caudoviricetes sp.]
MLLFLSGALAGGFVMTIVLIAVGIIMSTKGK